MTLSKSDLEAIEKAEAKKRKLRDQKKRRKANKRDRLNQIQEAELLAYRGDKVTLVSVQIRSALFIHYYQQDEWYELRPIFNTSWERCRAVL